MPAKRIRGRAGKGIVGDIQNRQQAQTTHDTTQDKMNTETQEQKNWYIVEVDIDGKYYGKFATYATCEQNARDIIAASDLGARNYDTITLAGFLYEGDALNDADTNQFHEIE